MDIELERLGNAAFVVIGKDGATNFGIVRGDDGSALLIDADIRRIDEIEESLNHADCNSVRYLFITHENFDHSSANDYFAKKGTVIVGSRGCVEALMDEGENKFAEMSGRSPDLFQRFPDLKMALPNIVVDGAATIRLPGATVHLRCYEQSHSRGDATAYLAEDDIFFAGDLLYTEVHPVTIYGRIATWIITLSTLTETPFGRIVPGHGPVGKSREQGLAQIETFGSYLDDFHRRLQDVRAGRKSAPEVQAEIERDYAALGKTWMVKRNIEHFLKNG